MKKFLFVVVILVSILTFSACNSTKYSDALNAFEAKDYETAITKFEELGDYKDCQDKVVKSIEKYIENNIISHNWKKAHEIIDTYKGIYEISYSHDDVAYFEGMYILENERSIRGFDILATISEQSEHYETVQTMIKDYYELQNSPIVKKFLGTWTCTTHEMDLTWKHTLSIYLEYNGMVIKHFCRQGDLLTSDIYRLRMEDIIEYTANCGKNEWKISPNGNTLWYSTEYSSYTFHR